MMPKFTLPKPKKKKRDGDQAIPAASDYDPLEYQRRVTLPVNPEILKAVETGQKVDVTLTGAVTRQVSDSGEYDEHSLTIDVSTVEVYPAEEGKQAKKRFSSGFNRAKGSY